MKGLVTRIKKALRLYKQLAIMSIETGLYTRTDFVFRIFSSLSSILVFLLFTETAIARYGDINGWTKYELILIYGIYLVAKGLMDSFVFENMIDIPDRIFHGHFDRYLVKPIRTLVFMSFEQLFIFNLADVIIGVIFIVISTQNLGITIYFGQILLILLSFVIMALTFFNVMVLLVSICFYAGRIGFIVFIYTNLVKVSSLPVNSHVGVYHTLFNIVLPFVLLGAIPAGILTRGFGLADVLPYTLIAIIWMMIGRFAWNRGMKSYTSAGG